MIKFKNTEVVGWGRAIRGMRNPLNSWDKIDSKMTTIVGDYDVHDVITIGNNDLNLMKKLRNAGSDHRKYLRMIVVYVDITAPLYWWKEFDTYKVGTVANSCSTMHTIADKEFTLDDFSYEHLIEKKPVLSKIVSSKQSLETQIEILNVYREMYLKYKDKAYWWQMIQLLPSSYNQKRTIMLNYEVLNNMYHARKNHKLDEWSIGFVEWVKDLPYADELIIKEEE